MRPPTEVYSRMVLPDAIMAKVGLRSEMIETVSPAIKSRVVFHAGKTGEKVVNDARLTRSGVGRLVIGLNKCLCHGGLPLWVPQKEWAGRRWRTSPTEAARPTYYEVSAHSWLQHITAFYLLCGL